MGEGPDVGSLARVLFFACASHLREGQGRRASSIMIVAIHVQHLCSCLFRSVRFLCVSILFHHSFVFYVPSTHLHPADRQETAEDAFFETST